MMETCIENNEALEILNNKLLETMHDKDITASNLLSPLSKIINLEHASQFKLVKETDTNRFNHLLLNKSITITPYNTLLTFLHTEKKFESHGDLSKVITNKN